MRFSWACRVGVAVGACAACAGCAATGAAGRGVLERQGDGFRAAPPARGESAERTRVHGRPRYVVEATVARVTPDAIVLDVALTSDADSRTRATGWFIDLVDDAGRRADEPEIVRESRARDAPLGFSQACMSSGNQLARAPGGEMLESAPHPTGEVCHYDEHYFTRTARLRFHRGALLPARARSLSLEFVDATLRLAVDWSITPEGASR